LNLIRKTTGTMLFDHFWLAGSYRFEERSMLIMKQKQSSRAVIHILGWN